MAKENKDLTTIKELIEIMKENDLVEVIIEHGDDKISLKRSSTQTQFSAVPMVGAQPGPLTPMAMPEAGYTPGPASAQPEEESLEITSPIVGTFYEAPSPDSEPYVSVGTHVSDSSVVCIIEAMKVMNEIKAEVSGTVTQILVSNGEAVEFGQPLFKVKPN